MTTEQFPSNLMAVDIQTFRNAIRDITFDVFLKLAENNYAHVFSKTTGLDYKRLAHYISKGVAKLYIRPEDEGAYKAFVQKTADSIFKDPNVTQERKIASLLNMTEQNMAELFTQMEVTKDTADNTRKVVNNYVSLMIEQPKTLAIILNLVSHGEYLYYHSIAVSVFSLFMAKASGQFNKRMLEIIGLGAFLHDIGCTKIPSEIMDSDKPLTPEQWQVIRNHPTVGLRMLEGTPNIPDEVRYIVYQHHEQPSGKGYPNKIRASVIYHPAKMIEIADCFSALISNRPWRKAYTVPEAIRIIQSEEGKHDPDLVKILASLFLRAGTGSSGSGSSTPSGGDKAAA